MKLFLIKYEVTFGSGKDLLLLADMMLVPGLTEKKAADFFLETVQRAGTLLMHQPHGIRVMAPIRDQAGKVKLLSCKKAQPKDLEVRTSLFV